MSASLDSFVAVPLSYALFMRLAARWPGGVSTGVEDVLSDFLERTETDFRAGKAEREGLQWESVHLPHGTRLRTKYFGDVHEASIEDGRIVWDNTQYGSVSRLASAMRGETSNNAWKVMEVKRAGDSQWIPADRLRR